MRELQNVIERAVLLGKHEMVRTEDLPPAILAPGHLDLDAIAAAQNLKAALASPERQIIMKTLEENNWNRNATADALGINRTTLYKKMKKLGLEVASRR
ncbi:MAG: helix-turn-helix domain-containing protein [Pirellulales bacterium]